ncbi:MerR family transcriptional regulator [Deinococcus metallilatus]|uniref:DNA-binding transcriptional MerR regulator n=1 Tax=Deinococcus metallilatus TaxID=1211322 RepID=A0AAJ5F4H5_9DEIO|nr:MerR family transcriptional regulator [Deinococcus metallilatus]MBB5295119.1 DNA-binding transcriptional MerR regulator [Deinococcus metallilatus]QBY08702.1 MerR family transcriptional regulator [Deinococcus metallilatus]RXJ10581.1 MerR family transcriptional regulator [Deinococcus metallilatus]TLK26552.1 MerR family transcriptional regulator [Deinococcus metallilatus]GMA14892.1 MerR family transcriptional regulator [Deinococcus metallilatus]
MKLRIGELARRTSLTVRTLRHYDQIGLLTPAGRTEAEHRLYSETDLRTLQQIQSLKAIGLPLGQIRAALQDPDHDPQRVIAEHIRMLEEQMERQRALLDRLKRLDVRGASWSELTEVIGMSEKVDRMLETARRVGEQPKFDDEQAAYIEQRRQEVGEARLREVEQEWPGLMAEVLREMEAGTPPSDPRVLTLARRWQGLVAEFTGGRQDIGSTLNRSYQQHMTPEMQTMWAYVGEAMKALDGSKQ